MDIQEAYLRFLTKVNKNLSSNNVTASKDRFVLLYNEEQIRRVEYILENKNDDEIREINTFLVQNNNLPQTSQIDDKAIVALPDDYLDLSSAYAYAKSADCEGIRLSLFEIKDFDSESYIFDPNNGPSLKWREAPFYVGARALNIITDNFEIERVHLSYYRHPRTIDISGYIDINGNASTDIDPEGDDAFVNKVISMCAESFFRNYGDANQFGIQRDRIINNI